MENKIEILAMKESSTSPNKSEGYSTSLTRSKY